MNSFSSRFQYSIAGVILLYVAVVVSVSAKENVFASIDYRDGLSSSSVSSIVQDSSGFLWFGTQNGLNRYDGTSFKLFENDPFNANSLSHNLIQTMFLDSDDVIWIGTYGGLNRFDTKTESFTAFHADHNTNDSLSNDLVISIFRDSRGNLWVGTIKGLNILDEKTGRFRRFFHNDMDSASLAADTVRSICEDYKGNLWIGTAGGGLDRFDYTTGTFIHHRHNPRDPDSLPSDSVMAVTEDLSGGLWVATWDYGLSRYDIVSGLFENHRIPDARSYCLNAKENNIVRLGSWGGGLWEYNTVTKTMTVSRHDSEGSCSLSHDVVYALFIDRTGDLWVGTNGGGVDRLDKGSGNYTVYKNDPKDPDSISPGKVTTVLEDHTGALWIGVYSGGVNRLDRRTGKFKHYRYNMHDPSSLSNDIVNYIYEDSRKTIWILTNEGLNRYVPSKDSFVRYYAVPGKNSLSSDIVYSMLEEPSSGNLWIATYTNGLDYLDIKTGQFRNYASSILDPYSLSDPLVSCLAYDSLGRLWVGTNNGANRMEADGSFVHYYHDVNNHASIPGNSLKSFFLDSYGMLWMTLAGGGLARYDIDADGFVTYGRREGLPTNSAVALLEDRHGNIWVSTQVGLAVLDRRTWQFRTFTVQNDLRDSEFSSGHCRSSSGELFFGGANALYCFDPDKIRYNMEIPPVRITGFKVFNEERRLNRAVYLMDTIHVSYRENYIGFSFTALNYRDPGKNEYAYKLEGFDHDWISCGNRQFAGYTNLPGGRYTFRVRGANNDGLWNFSGASVILIVSSPPWLRSWAITLYIAAGIGLIFFIVALKGRADLARKVRELTVFKQQLESANCELEFLSQSDGLTGIPNRRRLNEEYEHMYSYSLRERKHISILMLDIDYFKAYNDAYGHQAGDDCLCTIAKVISSSPERSLDFTARYGGEEFIVLLPDTDIEGAFRVAWRIHRNVESLRICHCKSSAAPFITVSIGIACMVPHSEVDRKELIRLADEALYRAKSAGRNCVSL